MACLFLKSGGEKLLMGLPLLMFANVSHLLIEKKIPNGCMGIGDCNNHQKSERGKSLNISALFCSISSADGAGPYLARRPLREWVGCLGDVASGASARILSIASRTNSSVERPFARAKAFSFACS